MHRLYVNGKMPCCLHCVCMEQHTVLMADLADLSDGLDSTDLVVCEHDGYQAGVLTDRCLQFLNAHDTLFMDRQQSDLIAFLLQFIQCMKDRMMFERSGDDVFLPFLPAYLCRTP